MTYTLHHGDCLEVMAGMEAGSVDAVVTDPPYSSGGQFRSEIARPVTEKYRGWSQNSDGSSRKPSAFYSAFSGDNKDGRVFMAWSKDWMDAAFRLADDGALFACTTDWRQIPAVTDAMQYAGWTWRGVIVWDKGIGRPVKGRFRNHVEYVVWGSRGAFVSDREVYPGSLYSETPPNHNDRVHITEKPVGLIRHILQVMPGGTVLDPFCGSGTTGVACAIDGFDFIGIDREAEYVEIARRRIEAAAAQLRMDVTA